MVTVSDDAAGSSMTYLSPGGASGTNSGAAQSPPPPPLSLTTTTTTTTTLSLLNFTVDAAWGSHGNNNDTIPSHCDLVLQDTAAPPPEYGQAGIYGVTVILVLVPLLTILGNSVTILAVLTHRKLRTKTNAFIVSLATADLCVALLVMPFGIYQQANNKVWTLGTTLCRLSASLDVMMCTVSIFHLSCLAIDRYLAICRPFLHERMTVRMIVAMLVFCWVVPVFISFLPIMNGWNELGIEDYLRCAFPPEAPVCVFIVNIPFAVVCSLIAFYVPVAFMGVCNVKIYMAASRQAHHIRALEEAGSQHHMSHHKRKKFRHETKAAKTLGIIMGCFSVCWFPFFILNVIDPVIGYRIPYVPWMVALWLGYINSMMNPVLYFFFNKRFNAAFHRLLRCRVCMGVRDYDEDMATGITNTSE
ncbi:5-hydroxytryptamine receptor 4-like [Babylonia areolata]|uniref:5-hydroxytryptamine receptor 4-like n=1 Tax=Babylonia areolata TaxID=304850 RepID=UPI003FD222B8